MGILTSESVGDVTYAQISEPYPMFTATTSYVAINSDGRMFTNVPNTGMWFSLDKTNYSEMQVWGNSSTITYTSSNNGIYTAFTSTIFTPTATTLDGFTTVTATTGSLTPIAFSADSDNVGRYFNIGLIDTYTPTTTGYDQMPFEIMPTLNNNPLTNTLNSVTGSTWGSGSDCVADVANSEVTIYANRILDIDGNNGDFVNIWQRPYTDNTTTYGTLRFYGYKFTTQLLEESTKILFENWVSGDTNGWNFANENQTNKWVIGSGTSYQGTYSAYITSGLTLTGSNTYNATATSISHLWKTIKLPVGNQSLFGKTPYYLSFRWKCLGNSTDYGSVYLTPTSVIPSGGTEINSGYKLNTIGFSGSSAYTNTKLVFTSTTSSTTVNVIDETWESGSFSGWTLANAATNKWIVGSGASYSGIYSGYISSGTTPTGNYLYDTELGSTQISHFYKDFTIPSSATSATLSFRWRCQGENGGGTSSWDYGAVYIIATGTTPVTGTEVTPTTLAPAGGNGRIGATTNLGKFNLAYNAVNDWHLETIDMLSYSGQTKRLVFSWVNDGSVGTQPPMGLDNIVLSYTVVGSSDTFVLDSDGYQERNLVFSWVNDNSTANNPPMSIDNILVYCYPSVI